ncbi:MAG: Trk family potassium uptake protein [Ruminococcus sp.]|nr:Trk family potassium uptake protein [Ruminococcus sp.]
MLKNKTTKRNHNSFRVITIRFFFLILTGALILMLPISSRDHTVTPFTDTLFTAVSASCVTGLVVRDTATHWSFFGQAVILTLIQIGGMGVITFGMMLTRLSGKKIGLGFRGTMQDSISAPQVGGIINLTKFILRMTAIIELSGAVLLYPVFCRDFGPVKGIWYALFHSVSAFCNAGFDLMGVREPFSSLTSYGDNIYVSTVLMLLIITGGIGFLTWDDVIHHRHHFNKYRLQTKIVLVTTALLIMLPAVFFFFAEYAGDSPKERILHSFFQSVTARTAGFNTADLSKMSESGSILMTVLMLIGGCSGSTAGGMKTSTVAVLFLAAISVYRRRNDVECFNRRIPADIVRTAGAILFMYITLFLSTGIAICLIDSFPLVSSLFETGSALGTAGLTLGITTSLSLPSRLILIVLMFAGRVGALTLIYATFASNNELSKFPQEKITVG